MKSDPPIKDFFKKVFGKGQPGSSSKRSTSGTPTQICKVGSKAKRCRRRKTRFLKKGVTTTRQYGR